MDEKTLNTCRNEPPPPELKGHSWRPLKPEHGYLDYGPRLFPDQADPALHYLRKNGERVKLPLSKDVVTIPTYYSFKKAYFFSSSFSFNGQIILDKEEAKCAVNRYWMYPDGRTEKICIPYKEEWKVATVLTYPVKSGIFLISYNRGKHGRTGHAGGYLIKNGQAEKTVSGYLSAASVSPDGCKMAFANKVESLSSKSSGSKLQVINLCKGKGE